MIAGSYCWPKRLGIQNRRCWGHTGSWLKIIRMLPALRAALLLPVQLSKTHKSQRSLRSLRHREDLSTVRSVQRAATKASGRRRKRKTLDLPHKLNVYKNIEVGGRGRGCKRRAMDDATVWQRRTCCRRQRRKPPGSRRTSRTGRDKPRRSIMIVTVDTHYHPCRPANLSSCRPERPEGLSARAI